jgi:hypothetical protein
LHKVQEAWDKFPGEREVQKEEDQEYRFPCVDVFVLSGWIQLAFKFSDVFFAISNTTASSSE